MTAFALKIIALVCMLIDHTGAIFYLDTPEFFRFIGRVSFPIFAFLIAEGCTYSKNMKKYLIRLGTFAIISEIPFDIAFGLGGFGSRFLEKINFIAFTNIFYTLFLGALAIYLYQLLYKKFSKSNEQTAYNPTSIEKLSAVAVSCLPVVPIAYASILLGTDYGAFGVLLIFCIYIARTTTEKLIVVSVGLIYKYGGVIVSMFLNIFSNGISITSIYFPYHQLFYLLFSLLSVVCIFFYNGKRGKSLKWVFYIFYPIHLLLLTGIYYLLYQ